MGRRAAKHISSFRSIPIFRSYLRGDASWLSAWYIILMALRVPFSVDEWYHCYARGIDGRMTFMDSEDYKRFLRVLYLANSSNPLHNADIENKRLAEVFEIPRPRTLVALGAFCLMPNHFHLLIKETVEGGISAFMQRLGTAYAMYFNTKYERVGGLFVKPFRSRHVNTDRYFQRALQYIHCNPAELYEPKWKMGTVRNMRSLEKKLLSYPYGSFGAHQGQGHMLRAILDPSVFEIAVQAKPQKMLEEARRYYADAARDYEDTWEYL